MAAGDWAQVVAAGAAATAAIAAWSTVHTARKALESQTRPIINAVPPGLFLAPREPAEGAAVEGMRDRAEIWIERLTGEDDQLEVSVPIRNVGTGAALIETVALGIGPEIIPGQVTTVLLPPSELTRANFTLNADSDEDGMGRDLATKGQDFAALIEYTDASGKRRGKASVEVANREYLYVKRSTFEDDYVGKQLASRSLSPPERLRRANPGV